MYLDTSPSIKNRNKLFWHCLSHMHQQTKEWETKWRYLTYKSISGKNVRIPFWWSYKITKAFCWTCWERHVNPYNK